MRRTLLTIAAAVLLSGTGLRADMNVKDFVAILAADDSTMTLTIKGYIEGLG